MEGRKGGTGVVTGPSSVLNDVFCDVHLVSANSHLPSNHAFKAMQQDCRYALPYRTGSGGVLIRTEAEG